MYSNPPPVFDRHQIGMLIDTTSESIIDMSSECLSTCPGIRSLRELVMSYFEHYYNLEQQKTLRNYSRPVNLERFDSIDWMTAEKDPWPIPEYLCTIAHTPLLDAAAQRRLTRVDTRLFAAGLVGLAK
jgi:hypothetical protein